MTISHVWEKRQKTIIVFYDKPDEVQDLVMHVKECQASQFTAWWNVITHAKIRNLMIYGSYQLYSGRVS